MTAASGCQGRGAGEDVRIRKVKILGGRLREQADKMGLQPNDLVIVKTEIKKGQLPIYSLEKIEGSPIDYLQKRLGEDGVNSVE